MWSAVFNERQVPAVQRRTTTPNRSLRPSSRCAADQHQSSAVYNAPPLQAVVPLPAHEKTATSFMTQVTKKSQYVTVPSYRAPHTGTQPNYHHYRSVRHPLHASASHNLLPYKNPSHARRHLLLLDLDETMVHASVQNVSHDVSFLVDMTTHQVPIFVKIRPYLAHFLQVVSRLFEVAVFTASLNKYADKVLDYLDPQGNLFTHRLFREHCTEVDGSYVKDLSLLGRPLERVLIVDNSPVAYLFHPQNALAIESWFEDPHDSELLKLLPLLERIARSDNAVEVLAEYNDQANFV